jgi:hypothetical protein
MDEDQVIAAAAEQGFELVERTSAGQWAWGWCRGGDERWPCFFERGQAVFWMGDRLRRITVFA